MQVSDSELLAGVAVTAAWVTVLTTMTALNGLSIPRASDMHLACLWIYPIKSTRLLALEQAEVESRGLRHDRRWMLVDANGRFITQRKHGVLTQVVATIDGQELRVNASGMPELVLSAPPADGERITVQVWNDSVSALAAKGGASDWFSKVLGMATQVVLMDESAKRAIDPAYALAGEQVSFADGFPLLLIGEGSLNDLNTRISQPVDMRHFRPNLVIAGSDPYAEDTWRRIRIGEIEFELVKKCSRCVLTTRNPDTGELDAQQEPLRTLSTYRREEEGVMFGQNLIARGKGLLQVGMPVTVIE